MTRIIDLSHPLDSGMPVYPGSSPVELTRTARIETHGFSEVQLSMPSHAGTHMDGPAHMISGGLGLDRFPPEQFVGTACVVTLSLQPQVRIETRMLISWQPQIESAEIILIHTGWSRLWGNRQYFDGYPVLSVEAASWLADFSPKAIGVDTPSVDAHDATDYPNHHVFFEKNIILIENLCRLHDLPGTGFTVVCLPLPIRDADGAPARAIAIL